MHSYNFAGFEFEPGEIVYVNPLSKADDLKGWIIESSKAGNPSITFPGERMRLESDVHFLLWCPKRFPDKMVVSWDFRPRSDDGLAMFWIAAKGRKGECIFDPQLKIRDGTYSQYNNGDINAMHVSYFRRNSAGRKGGFHEINFQTCVLRKSHGFHLVAVSGDPIPGANDAVKPYRIRAVKYEKLFRFYIDDLLVIAWDDDEKTGPFLKDGKIGFRQMKGLIADYSNLEVRRIFRTAGA